MIPIDPLRDAATHVAILVIGSVWAAFLVPISVRIAAGTLRAVMPRLGIRKALLAGLVLALVGVGVRLAFNAAAGGNRQLPFIEGVISIPAALLVVWPVEFFVLAGLMIRLLPTTLGRACFVSLLYLMLNVTVLLVVTVFAILDRLDVF